MTVYDLVEYPSKPFAQCHADRLALMARLFGVDSQPPARARILEIGCGDGLNLMASAMVLPGARFYGIDISQRAIRRGREMVRELGLKNVHLEHRDFQSLPARRNGFHYVVAHGLYSWIPADLRDFLLGVVKRTLAPCGIAYISYNAYPGAYLRQMVREMAGLFAGESISEARQFLETARRLTVGPPVYRAVVADEAKDMLDRENGALFHDDLAPPNDPCWFRDFISHANAHGLEYVSEADLATTGGYGLPAEAHEGLARDRIRLEQYADFLRGRRFRQTLLCHAGQKVSPEPDSSALKGCHAGGPLNPGLPSTDGKVEYVNRVGHRFRTNVVKEQFILESVAAAWPGYLSVNDLGRDYYAAFLALFAAGIIDLRTIPPPVNVERVFRRGSRPEASPLARAQARRGASVTTLHHLELLIESETVRTVLCLADGTRSRARLLRDFAKLHSSEPKDKLAIALDRFMEELRLYGLLLENPGKQQGK